MVREDSGFGDAIVTIRADDGAKTEQRIRAVDVRFPRDLPEVGDVAVRRGEAVAFLPLATFLRLYPELA